MKNKERISNIIFSSKMQNAYYCIAAFLFVLAYNKIFIMQKVTSYYIGVSNLGFNAGSILLFGVTFLLLKNFVNNSDKRMAIISVILGIVMAIFAVWGTFIFYENDIFISGKSLANEMLLAIGLSFFFVPFVGNIYVAINKISCNIKSTPKAVNSKWDIYMDEHPGIYYIFSWLLIFVAWLPLFLANWPGNFIFDAKYQMSEVIDNYYYTHHPLAHTLFMGWAYKLGSKWGNVSLGFSIYTVLQMLIVSSCMAYCISYLRQRKVNAFIRVLSLLWFMLFPLNKLMAITATKDVLCAGFMLVFMICVLKLIRGEHSKVVNSACMIVFGTLACLYRNNMLYAVLAGGIIVVIMTKGLKQRAVLLGLFFAVLITTKISNTILVKAVDAHSTDSYKEALSVPIQGLARVEKYRGDELSPELLEEIRMYFDSSNYNPFISDAVKDGANESLLEADILKFVKLWIKVGLRFPDEYIESIISNTIGYWFQLDCPWFVASYVETFHVLIGKGEEISKECYIPEWLENIYLYFYYHGEIYNLPIVGYFMRCAVYVWGLVLAFFYGIYQKNIKFLKIVMIPLMYLFTCFLGPMTMIRYIYPIIILVPLIINEIMSDCSENGELNG